MLTVREIMKELGKLDPELSVAVPDMINYDDLVLREATNVTTMLLHPSPGGETTPSPYARGASGERDVAAMRKSPNHRPRRPS